MARIRIVAPAAAVALLLLAAPARADDILLRNGEVIEAEVDPEATRKANAGVAPEGRVTVYRTETGAEGRVAQSEIRAIRRRKTTWQIRAEALDWYRTEVERPPETAAAHEALARRCRDRGLETEALRHYMQALKLRRDVAGESSEARLELARWCRRVGLDEAEARTELLHAYRLERARAAAASGEPADAWMDLCAWCREQGLIEEALAACEEALLKDPLSLRARRAASELKSSPEHAAARLADLYEREGRAVSLTVAVEENVDPGVLRGWRDRIEDLSRFVFEITQGQFLIAECRIEDLSSSGRIVVERGKVGWASLDGPEARGVLAYTLGTGRPDWTVRAPGRIAVEPLCHELFHGLFGLKDEYEQARPCPCLMRAAPNPKLLCTAETHVPGGAQPEPCWETIRRRFPTVRVPNPDWSDAGLAVQGVVLPSPPPPRIILVDH